MLLSTILPRPNILTKNCLLDGEAYKLISKRHFHNQRVSNNFLKQEAVFEKNLKLYKDSVSVWNEKREKMVFYLSVYFDEEDIKSFYNLNTSFGNAFNSIYNIPKNKHYNEWLSENDEKIKLEGDSRHAFDRAKEYLNEYNADINKHKDELIGNLRRSIRKEDE